MTTAARPGMVYRWKDDHFGDKLLEHAARKDLASAQRVGEALAVIAGENDGNINPRDVVAEARSSASVLHRFFEWDDRKAAFEHRLHQARKLVLAIAYIVPDAEVAPPAFVPTSVMEDGETRAVFKPAALTRQAPPIATTTLDIERALRELASWRRRYGQITALRPVVDAIDEQLQHPFATSGGKTVRTLGEMLNGSHG